MTYTSKTKTNKCKQEERFILPIPQFISKSEIYIAKPRKSQATSIFAGISTKLNK